MCKSSKRSDTKLTEGILKFIEKGTAMSTNSVSFIDKTFWLTESEANPKHVGSMQIMQMPENSGSDYVDQLTLRLKQFGIGHSPYDCVVKTRLGYPLKLETVPELNMDYHVQLHIVDDVTDKQKIQDFVANLHETLLERDKPLWQCHLIKDNRSDTYIAYYKVHHIYGDGATLVRRFQSSYTAKADLPNFKPFWATQKQQSRRPQLNCKTNMFTGITNSIRSIFDIAHISTRLMLKILMLNGNYMPVPFSADKSVLTGQVSKGRVFSTVDLDFERIKSLGKKLRVSANEILLCSFDMALQRFLVDHNHTSTNSLYVNMPIDLRKNGDESHGNKIAIVPVKLAQGDLDPFMRLRQIADNHRVVKDAVKSSNGNSFSYYTLMIQSVALGFELMKLSNLVKPIANSLISNVPGPSTSLYLAESKVLASYPLSTITPGGGVNITIITYAGVANIGMVCCDERVTSLEPLSKYFLSAFDLLERCIDEPNLSIKEMEVEVESQIIEDGYLSLDAAVCASVNN